MGAQFYSMNISPSLPFQPPIPATNGVFSNDGRVIIKNFGPDIVYVGSISKASPTVVAPSEHSFQIHPGETAEVPSDTTQDPNRLGLNTASNTSSVVIIVAG